MTSLLGQNIPTVKLETNESPSRPRTWRWAQSMHGLTDGNGLDTPQQPFHHVLRIISIGPPISVRAYAALYTRALMLEYMAAWEHVPDPPDQLKHVRVHAYIPMHLCLSHVC